MSENPLGIRTGFTVTANSVVGGYTRNGTVQKLSFDAHLKPGGKHSQKYSLLTVLSPQITSEELKTERVKGSARYRKEGPSSLKWSQAFYSENNLLNTFYKVVVKVLNRL